MLNLTTLSHLYVGRQKREGKGGTRRNCEGQRGTGARGEGGGWVGVGGWLSEGWVVGGGGVGWLGWRESVVYYFSKLFEVCFCNS
jgi:hypothetical protein